MEIKFYAKTGKNTNTKYVYCFAIRAFYIWFSLDNSLRKCIIKIEVFNTFECILSRGENVFSTALKAERKIQNG